MATCPKCNSKVDCLENYRQERVCYVLTLLIDGKPNYREISHVSTKEGGSEYGCPECGEFITHDEKKAITFLMGENRPGPLSPGQERRETMTDFHAHLPMWAKELADKQEIASAAEAKAGIKAQQAQGALGPGQGKEREGIKMAEESEWDLTDEEALALRERFYAKIGRSRLVEALIRHLGEEASGEITFWKGLRRRLSISARAELMADFTTRKIWLKGSVCPDAPLAERDQDTV